MTEAYPTCHHTFNPRRMLTPEETIDDYMEVTAAEQAKLEAADAVWVRPEQAFIDRYNAELICYAGENWPRTDGKYNEATGRFDAYGLSLTTAETQAMLAAGRIDDGTHQSAFSCNNAIRVNLRPHNMTQYVSRYPFYYCSKMEICNAYGLTASGPFYGCPALHTINELDDVSGAASINPLLESSTLVNLTIAHLTASLNLSNQPSVTLASFRQIISKAANTKEITITVHPDVYAKLSGTDSALSAEDAAAWQQVMADAAAKNIIFATTN